jgi:hypothetical protein
MIRCCAPAVFATRHPGAGAVWQPRLPYGNFTKTKPVTNPRSPDGDRQLTEFPYGNQLIFLGESNARTSHQIREH